MKDEPETLNQLARRTLLPALLTHQEAAELLRLTPRQVLRPASRGELPSVVFPNRETRFDAADLSRFIELHKRPAAEGGAK